jgi:hypothetical protein
LKAIGAYIGIWLCVVNLFKKILAEVKPKSGEIKKPAPTRILISFVMRNNIVYSVIRKAKESRR